MNERQRKRSMIDWKWRRRKLQLRMQRKRSEQGARLLAAKQWEIKSDSCLRHAGANVRSAERHMVLLLPSNYFPEHEYEHVQKQTSSEVDQHGHGQCNKTRLALSRCCATRHTINLVRCRRM